MLEQLPVTDTDNYDCRIETFFARSTLQGFGRYFFFRNYPFYIHFECQRCAKQSDREETDAHNSSEGNQPIYLLTFRRGYNPFITADEIKYETCPLRHWIAGNSLINSPLLMLCSSGRDASFCFAGSERNIIPSLINVLIASPRDNCFLSALHFTFSGVSSYFFGSAKTSCTYFYQFIIHHLLCVRYPFYLL